MELITSKTNPRVKSAAALLDRRERKKTGLFLLEGARLCADAAQNGVTVETLFLTEAAAEKYPAEAALLRQKAKQAFLLSEAAAERLADTKNSQHIFCVCQRKTDRLPTDPRGLYVFLDNVQNPDNLGAVSRTAEALGFDGLIVSGGCEADSPKALRASMGALLRFPVTAVEDGAAWLADRRAEGMRLLATVPDRAADDITQLKLTSGAVLVIGNEGSGVSEQTLAVCTDRVTIPMAGKAESLNAAAAAAIAMWEISRKSSVGSRKSRMG